MYSYVELSPTCAAVCPSNMNICGRIVYLTNQRAAFHTARSELRGLSYALRVTLSPPTQLRTLYNPQYAVIKPPRWLPTLQPPPALGTVGLSAKLHVGISFPSIRAGIDFVTDCCVEVHESYRVTSGSDKTKHWLAECRGKDNTDNSCKFKVRIGWTKET